MIGVIGVEEFKLRCKVGGDEQDLFIDLDVELDLSEAIAEEHVTDTVNYRDLAEMLELLVEGREFHLIEKIAHEILHNLFERFPVTWASVRVKQPQAIALAKCVHVELEAFAEEEE